MITGATPRISRTTAADRKRELSRFRKDPDCHVLIATPQTLGEGVSLHRVCTRQLHVDRTFNAGIYLQALDRTHRLGLDPGAVCEATMLVSEVTLDEAIEQRLAAKVGNMAALLDDPDLGVLRLPDFDDTLSIADMLLGPSDAADLAELFRHLKG